MTDIQRLKPIDSVNGHCDECGDGGMMAALAGKLLCGACCRDGMHVAGVDEEDRIGELESEVADHEETIADLRAKVEKLTALEADACTALRAQESIASELAKKLDAVKRVTDGLALLPEPTPKKPRAKKPAEATP